MIFIILAFDKIPQGISSLFISLEKSSHVNTSVSLSSVLESSTSEDMVFITCCHHTIMALQRRRIHNILLLVFVILLIALFHHLRAFFTFLFIDQTSPFVVSNLRSL